MTHYFTACSQSPIWGALSFAGGVVFGALVGVGASWFLGWLNRRREPVAEFERAIREELKNLGGRNITNANFADERDMIWKRLVCHNRYMAKHKERAHKGFKPQWETFRKLTLDGKTSKPPLVMIDGLNELLDALHKKL